jgi:hypothetical protein
MAAEAAAPENTGRKQRTAVIKVPEPCNSRKAQLFLMDGGAHLAWWP